MFPRDVTSPFFVRKGFSSKETTECTISLQSTLDYEKVSSYVILLAVEVREYRHLCKLRTEQLQYISSFKKWRERILYKI